MLLLYNLIIRLYYLAVLSASLFNNKAKLWIKGRKVRAFIRFDESIWFHFASLGEFEQGRPVLERSRELYPGTKIVITFFSPSGYEVRKNTPLADAVYYLPLDTASNAREFINTIQPKLVVFTKYEYWYYFFREARKRDIPVYVISAIFRPGQVFFKWFGGLSRKILGFVSWFFVQDERSKHLLAGIGLTNVSVSGDTRFDRVWANAQHPKAIPGLAEFKNSHKVFVAGSTWPDDEKLLIPLIKDHPGLKFILAPHEIHEDKIEKLIDSLPAGIATRYSQFTGHPDGYHGSPFVNCQVLIIDNIGMLSSLYQYGDIAYIGGGFGVGIHNTLEAAAFGMPVIFGPNYKRFKEACDLLTIDAGFSIGDEAALSQVVKKLLADPVFFANACLQASDYVKNHIGATEMIVGQLNRTI
jgi:3-deoxy-D-manno-octulosonic-acid transferase